MIITSTANPTIRSVRQLHTRKGRRAAGRTFVEGPNGLEAAIRHAVPIETVVCTEDDAAARRFAHDRGLEPLLVTERVLASVADTRTPRGPVLTVAIPEPEPLRARNTVVLVDVSDPGNVGTIVRSALAFGWDVAMAGATADPWSPKVLRASAGTCLGAHLSSLVDPIGQADAAGLGTVALVVEGGVAPSDLGGAGPIALLVGSEAHGLPGSLVEQVSHRSTLPMHGDVESLNASVAASVAMYLFTA